MSEPLTPEQLAEPLTAIECGELTVTCQKVLTAAGNNLLRRLMFERESLRDELRRLRDVAEPLAVEWREHVASNGAGAAITTTGLLVRAGPLRALAALLPAKETT